MQQKLQFILVVGVINSHEWWMMMTVELSVE
jgi:hypothetical protein